jgi:3D (Asp-Asp-Asp) domain-containing protein
MAIEFIEVTKEVVVEEEEIPFEVTTVDDKNILKGKSEVKQEGVVGKKELTYDLTYENGVLVQKTLESEIVSVEPIEKIVHNGIKEEIKVASRGSKGYMSVIATAYSGDTITSTGTTPKWGTIAVDPSVIPYGTKVYIPQFDKVFVAEDCGGAIKGNKIDIFMNSNSQCNNWGRRRIDIYIVS